MSESRAATSIYGAATRAVAVVLAMMLPVILVPDTAPETGQIVLLLALFVAAVVMAEYASAYPALIEFRFAPPFNRTRFGLLAVAAAVLALMQRGGAAPGPLSDAVLGLGAACGAALDMPFSPVRLLVGALPPVLAADEVLLIRDGAALVWVVSLVTLAGFIAATRLNLWPMGQAPFNVWINLPTFDPTAGNDVVRRLQRHARVNVFLGVIMPFLLPGAVLAAEALVVSFDYSAPLMFVWGLTLWAVLPTALVMRGVAMARVARMIRANRRHLADSARGVFVAA